MPYIPVSTFTGILRWEFGSMRTDMEAIFTALRGLLATDVDDGTFDLPNLAQPNAASSLVFTGHGVNAEDFIDQTLDPLGVPLGVAAEEQLPTVHVIGQWTAQRRFLLVALDLDWQLGTVSRSDIFDLFEIDLLVDGSGSRLNQPFSLLDREDLQDTRAMGPTSSPTVISGWISEGETLQAVVRVQTTAAPTDGAGIGIARSLTFNHLSMVVGLRSPHQEAHT